VHRLADTSTLSSERDSALKILRQIRLIEPGSYESSRGSNCSTGAPSRQGSVSCRTAATNFPLRRPSDSVEQRPVVAACKSVEDPSRDPDLPAEGSLPRVGSRGQDRCDQRLDSVLLVTNGGQTVSSFATTLAT